MAGFEITTKVNDRKQEALIIENSATIYKGSFADFDGGFIQAATATNALWFYVTGIVDSDGIPLEVSEKTYDGTYTKGGIGVANYVAASDNETDKQVKALGYYVLEGDEFESVPDADIGTTTGSNLPGYFTDLINAYTVDESDAGTGAAQLTILGVSRKDSTKGRYRVNERAFNA